MKSSAESKSKRIVLAAVVAGLTVLVASPAFAQDAADKGDKGEGYGYEFEDDPLNAGGFGPNDATIKVRPRAARTTLIRPRTSFVTEMLKSVENI
ncbi:MAG TPA: hypothetical protein VFQ61_08910 [Polyangiaceae bacterium]|nr:hypothetical protein [Polyangiaceae bacterium]